MDFRGPRSNSDGRNDYVAILYEVVRIILGWRRPHDSRCDPFVSRSSVIAFCFSLLMKCEKIFFIIVEICDGWLKRLVVT